LILISVIAIDKEDEAVNESKFSILMIVEPLVVSSETVHLGVLVDEVKVALS
jgi:hypothetical protein